VKLELELDPESVSPVYS